MGPWRSCLGYRRRRNRLVRYCMTDDARSYHYSCDLDGVVVAVVADDAWWRGDDCDL